MKVIMLSHAFLLLMVASTLASDNNESHKHGIRETMANLPSDRVFIPQFGKVTELYQADGVVRNLLAPLDLNMPSLSFDFNPTLYFNIYNEDGQNQGLYVLKDDVVTKINDGRDSTVEYPKGNNYNENIYIATADGIHVYDPHTETVQKYGNLTDDVIAIDKVSGKDVIYILCADHKIYTVTNHGTQKELVEGVDYAKDFVLDFTEGIHYIGEDNKPRFLLKGSSVPYQYQEFDFDVVNPILARPIFNPFVEDGGQNRVDYSVMLVVDGVLIILTNNQSMVHPQTHKVPGITAFSFEFLFFNYIAADGKILLHNLAASKPRDKEEVKQSSQSSGKKTSNRVEA